MNRVCLTPALLALGLAAGAHEPHAPTSRAVLDPPGWPGITAQVQHTLAPQLVVENRSAQTLEVLDPAGRGFLRISPSGVQADFNAAAWYRTFSTAGIAVPASARDPGAAPRWTAVSRGNSWGWFDPRLAPHEASSWRVPVALGGKPAALTGRFVPTAAPPGRYEALLDSPAPPGLTVQVVQGELPALLMSSRVDAPVIVLGLEREPYLRFDGRGVSVNLHSPTWRRYGRSTGLLSELAEGVAEQWVRVSPERRYAWLEPRLQGRREHSSKWSVPLEIGGQRVDLHGHTAWVPAP